jgi:hypothetical protein
MSIIAISCEGKARFSVQRGLIQLDCFRVARRLDTTGQKTWAMMVAGFTSQVIVAAGGKRM